MSAQPSFSANETESASPDNTDSSVAAASETPTLQAKELWPLSKWQAFGLHMALSILIFASLIAVMLIWWFPGELFILDGGWEGLKLVAMVDLILGPALTLLLYKPGKPKLAMDMSLIAAFQIAALAYGFYTMHQQRTVAVVHSEKVFVTLSATALKEADEKLLVLNETALPLSRFASGHPRMLINPTPKNGETYGKYLEQIRNGYPLAYERSDQFAELAGHLEMVSKSAWPIDELPNPGQREAVEAAIASAGLQADELEFHDFRARYASGIVIFDPKSVKILDYVVVDSSARDEVASSED